MGVARRWPHRAGRTRWSLDLVHDQMTEGRRFRILTVVDGGPRGSLARILYTSTCGARITWALGSIIARRGLPVAVVAANGIEITSNAGLGWIDKRRVAREDIQPGEPVQNAFTQSFRGRPR